MPARRLAKDFFVAIRVIRANGEEVEFPTLVLGQSQLAVIFSLETESKPEAFN